MLFVDADRGPALELFTRDLSVDFGCLNLEFCKKGLLGVLIPLTDLNILGDKGSGLAFWL